MMNIQVKLLHLSQPQLKLLQLSQLHDCVNASHITTTVPMTRGDNPGQVASIVLK